MKNVLRLELKKAIRNRYFWISIAFLCILGSLSALYMIQNNGNFNPDSIDQIYAMTGQYRANLDLSTTGFFDSWVGGECLSLAYSVFYTLLPVAAALPFSWSFFIERKSGYIKSMLSRTSKKRYFFAKAVAVFLSGALAVLLPLLLNVYIVCTSVPTYLPQANEWIYTHVNFGGLWADLYYTYPWVFLLLYVLLTAVYGGLFALLSFSVTFYLHNRFALLLTPFLAFLVLQNVEHSISSQGTLWIREAVPMSFLHTTAPMLITDGWIVLAEALLFLLFSFATIYLKGCRDEIL